MFTSQYTNVHYLYILYIYLFIHTQTWIYTHYYVPANLHRPCHEFGIGRLVPTKNLLFSGSMLIYWRVYAHICACCMQLRIHLVSFSIQLFTIFCTIDQPYIKHRYNCHHHYHLVIKHWLTLVIGCWKRVVLFPWQCRRWCLQHLHPLVALGLLQWLEVRRLPNLRSSRRHPQSSNWSYVQPGRTALIGDLPLLLRCFARSEAIPPNVWAQARGFALWRWSPETPNNTGWGYDISFLALD